MLKNNQKFKSENQSSQKNRIIISKIQIYPKNRREIRDGIFDRDSFIGRFLHNNGRRAIFRAILRPARSEFRRRFSFGDRPVRLFDYFRDRHVRLHVRREAQGLGRRASGGSGGVNPG